jgi:hypothetical protein
MSLIALDDGDIINTEHVVKFALLGNGRYKFALSDGNIACGETDDPEEKFWPVLPAAAGYCGLNTGFLRDERFWTTRVIVGWRICPGGNHAILEGMAEVGDDYGCAAICQPDGRVIDDDGNLFATVDDYKAAVAAEDAANVPAKAA